MKLRMTGATLVMSYEAISWVLRDAPDVPSQCVSVLVGLAEHADRLGRGAYPSAATLAIYARKSERQVRYDLALLGDAKLIRPGDQTLVKKYPPNRRPVVYDLAVERARTSPDVQPTAPQEADPGVQPAAGVQPTAPRQSTAPQTGPDLQEHPGVQSVAPQEPDFLGCNAAQPGVQPTAYKPPLNLPVVDAGTQGGSGGDDSAPSAKAKRRSRRDLNEGRDDVMRLCAHLADRLELQMGERPDIGRKWLDSARLMLDSEKRTEEQIHKAIDWCKDDSFWCDVILSMTNLRKHYTRMRAQATRANGNGSAPPPGSRPSTADQRLAEIQARKERDRQQREGQQSANVIQGSVISDQ